VFRFLLGMGEGGGFPGSAKAVANWFPPKERSFAFGIFNTGSSIGAVIAPPIIAAIVIYLNWRWVFFITGALGFVWAAGSFGGMIFNCIVGMLLTRYHSYSIVFLISGLLHPTGFFLTLLLVRKVEMLVKVPAAPSLAAET
jgi:MFS family permease